MYFVQYAWQRLHNNLIIKNDYRISCKNCTLLMYYDTWVDDYKMDCEKLY